MGDYPFVELLRQGPVAWNDWRRDNPHVALNIYEANLSGLVLDGANLDDATLFEAVLANTSLVGANLRRVVLQGADLRGANLRSADLSDADLSGTWDDDPTVRLSWPGGADLRDASLHDTLFARTMLRGCQFSGARLNGTIFSDVNLSLAQGLEDAIHEGPSQVTVSTLAQSRGVLSRAFFAKCHVGVTMYRLPISAPRTESSVTRSCICCFLPTRTFQRSVSAVRCCSQPLFRRSASISSNDTANVTIHFLSLLAMLVSTWSGLERAISAAHGGTGRGSGCRTT